MEQALLPGTVRSGSPGRGSSAGTTCSAFCPRPSGRWRAGASLGWALAGLDERRGLSLHAVGLRRRRAPLTLLYASLSQAVPSPAPARRADAPLGVLGPAPIARTSCCSSRALQGLDALAGGFIMQSLLAYWFHVRFGVGPEALGALFFGTNLLSALSFLVATRVADRFGLLNTMVFTHLPSNVLLLVVPFMPSFTAAALVLLARHVLSQMDVPTRQAYTMALVAPEERPAAAGLTGERPRPGPVLRARSCPGLTMAAAATGLPFFLAGGLKIVYDLALFARFRSVPLRGES